MDSESVAGLISHINADSIRRIITIDAILVLSFRMADKQQDNYYCIQTDRVPVEKVVVRGEHSKVEFQKLVDLYAARTEAREEGAVAYFQNNPTQALRCINQFLIDAEVKKFKRERLTKEEQERPDIDNRLHCLLDEASKGASWDFIP